MVPPNRAAVAAAGMIAASAAAMALLQAPPRDAAEVAVLFAPWHGGDGAFAAVARAGGRVVRQGLIPTILVVHGEDPGLIERLYSGGAWLVMDPVVFGGCLTAAPGKST